MNELDSHIVDVIMDKAHQWFDKSFNNRAVLDEGLFNHSIKSTKGYGNRISVRVKFINGELGIGVFDCNEQRLEICSPRDLENVLPRKSTARFVLAASQIWYVSGRCGFSWDIFQIQIMDAPMTVSTNTFMFRPIEDKKDEDML